MLLPEGQYIGSIQIRSLCLPGDLCNTLGPKQMTQLIESINKLRYLTKVSVNGTSQWLQIGQVKGYQGSHLLHMSGQAESGRLSAASASVVCGLALENFGVTDLNLSRNEFGEVCSHSHFDQCRIALPVTLWPWHAGTGRAWLARVAHQVPSSAHTGRLGGAQRHGCL